MKNIQIFLDKYCKIVDEALKDYIDAVKITPQSLAKAMHYAVFSGGKRFRAILAMAAADVLGKSYKMVLPAACSIELIHNFSLIHDDLPCMDNDDFRRGRPTVHKIFGEALALLAGDALLARAFDIMTEYLKESRIKKENVLMAIKELATSTGFAGMVGGQALDVTVGGGKITGGTLKLIHSRKTGALICASVRISAILLDSKKSELNALSRYARNIGLVYQIIDDILDKNRIEESSFLRIYGHAASRKIAEEHTKGAVRALEIFGRKAEILKELAFFLLNRKR